MTTKSKPQPGQLWRTNMIGGVAVKTREGWTWLDGEPITVAVRPRGDGPVGYTVEHVEKLREVQRDLRADALTEARAERDEAIRRAEAAEGALSDAKMALADAPTEHEALANLADREPWRVLRAAADVASEWSPLDWAGQHLADLADRLRREHAETAKRDRIVKTARSAFASASGITTGPVDGWMEAVVDAVLAEAVDDQ